MKTSLASLLLFTSAVLTTPIYPFADTSGTTLDINDPIEYQYKQDEAKFSQKPFTLDGKKEAGVINTDADADADDETKDSNPQSTESPSPMDAATGSEPELNFNLPSWPTTHLLARRLLALSTTGVLSTVYPEGSHPSSLAGTPVGLPDYFADCTSTDADDEVASLLGAGNPLILALNLGTTFKNTKAGSNISLSVDWWDRFDALSGGSGSGSDGGDLDTSPASLPRLALMGSLEKLPLAEMSESTREAVEKCFLAAHPDAKYWLPGRPGAAHSGYWARLAVDKALWIGGFGDRARIGWLDTRVWRSIKKSGGEGEEGWGDVRLPGEQE